MARKAFSIILSLCLIFTTIGWKEETDPMFTQNNLDKASSPYLRQHKDNPVWWQEWDEDVLEYAKKEGKPIFVSVGYATCHWCHVMAGEAFSDKTVADYLNENFVSIKVDKEQRPDIDQFLMNFMIVTGGRGGWPLNVFLTPDLKPFSALSYAPLEPQYGMPPFIEILKGVKSFYDSRWGELPAFIPTVQEPTKSKEKELIKKISRDFDSDNGGFGVGSKFPSHSTMLFMLYYYAATGDGELKKMIEKTLDTMLLRGLHDHLQGGFFRYCVDNAWTIPHFEKMLYDQAMHLWVYSLAYKAIGKKEYKITALKIIKCLEETYEEGGLFYSAHDADTDHEEGGTYLWTEDELKRLLTKEEYKQFTDVYNISGEGNFKSKNHLVKNKALFLEDIEQKLLDERNKRKQPFTDKKFVTSWNCLLGIGLIQAYRCLGIKESLEKAEQIFDTLIKNHYVGEKLYHSSLSGKVQDEEFLQDYASMLLFLTYLYEERIAGRGKLEEFRKKVESFKKNDIWIEARNEDFREVLAEAFDHPTPSSISMAELGLLRSDILMGNDYNPCDFREPMYYGFMNVVTLVKNGLFHIIDTPKKISWEELPINVIQVKAKKLRDCYKGVCTDKLQV